MAKYTLVTLDMDGTMIKYGGESRKHPIAFMKALKNIYDIDFDGYAEDYIGHRVDGGTDRSITKSIIERAHGAAMEEDIARFQRETESVFMEIAKPGFDATPNLHEFLESLSKVPNVKFCIASGNFKAILWRKLELVGISKFFSRQNGGYGTVLDRRDILKEAEASYGDDIVFDRRIHVGDTLADAEAAAAMGFEAVVVTTGRQKSGFPESTLVLPELPVDASQLLRPRVV